MHTWRWVVLFSLVLTGSALGGIPESEYRDRRARLIALADSDAVLVFHAATTHTRSGDVTYPYRQESNFLYLTGITEQGIILMLCPRGVTVNGTATSCVLFCPKDVAASLKDSGVFAEGQIVPVERFRDAFEQTRGKVRTLLVAGTNLPFMDDWLNDRRLFLDQEARKLFQQNHPGLTVKNAGPLVGRLRRCKSTAELELIRDAIRMTGDGIARAAGVCRDGAKEYEMQAAVEYEMVRQGASGPAFPCIIGSGPNSLDLHYDLNRRTMKDGDLVVVDVGAEYEGYSADVTRTLPVSGTFTEAQRHVYAAVLKAQAAVIAMIRPGIRWSEIEGKAREVVAAEGFRGRMTHGVSHHIGLDTHDAGGMDVLQEGMVITVEPGIYIAEKDTAYAPEFRNFGIRIEDDVLVSKDGAVVLSSGIPKEPEAIEELVRSSR